MFRKCILYNITYGSIVIVQKVQKKTSFTCSMLVSVQFLLNYSYYYICRVFIIFNIQFHRERQKYAHFHSLLKINKSPHCQTATEVLFFQCSFQLEIHCNIALGVPFSVLISVSTVIAIDAMLLREFLTWKIKEGKLKLNKNGRK